MPVSRTLAEIESSLRLAGLGAIADDLHNDAALEWRRAAHWVYEIAQRDKAEPVTRETILLTYEAWNAMHKWRR